MKNEVNCSGYPGWIDDRDLGDADWVEERWD